MVCVKTSHTRCLRKLIMVEVSGHLSKPVNVINVFHGGKLILQTVTNICPKTWILLEYYQYFL